MVCLLNCMHFNFFTHFVPVISHPKFMFRRSKVVRQTDPARMRIQDLWWRENFFLLGFTFFCGFAMNVYYYMYIVFSFFEFKKNFFGHQMTDRSLIILIKLIINMLLALIIGVYCIIINWESLFVWNSDLFCIQNKTAIHAIH